MLASLRQAIPGCSGPSESDFESAQRKMGSHPPRQPDWANLEIIHRNTLAPRSNFVLYDSEQDALSGDVSKAKALTLSGKWRFHLAPNPFEAPPGFEASDFDSSEWSKIQVPGMWQVQGFGKGPHYTNGKGRLFHHELQETISANV